jgi:hypothetical protein
VPSSLTLNYLGLSFSTHLTSRDPNIMMLASWGCIICNLYAYNLTVSSYSFLPSLVSPLLCFTSLDPQISILRLDDYNLIEILGYRNNCDICCIIELCEGNKAESCFARCQTCLANSVSRIIRRIEQLRIIQAHRSHGQREPWAISDEWL